mgnify:CR=1 FL=1
MVQLTYAKCSYGYTQYFRYSHIYAQGSTDKKECPPLGGIGYVLSPHVPHATEMRHELLQYSPQSIPSCAKADSRGVRAKYATFHPALHYLWLRQSSAARLHGTVRDSARGAASGSPVIRATAAHSTNSLCGNTQFAHDDSLCRIRQALHPPHIRFPANRISCLLQCM